MFSNFHHISPRKSTKSILTCLLLFAAWNSSGQCPGNLISNGSFNGPKGEAVISPGWTGQSTPDTNDENGPLMTTPGYTWTGTPQASSDGGTWQNMFSNVEYIEQTLNLTVGESYLLTFEYTAQGIQVDNIMSFTDPVGFDIYFDNSLVNSTPLDATPFTWETYSYTFTATQSTVVLKLSPNVTAYAAVDGICLIPDPEPPVTEPEPEPEPQPIPDLTSVVNMPDIFTPDNNGINDLFHPKEFVNIKAATLRIVNRWGNPVYETSDPMSGWNGKFNGNDCTEGVYFWILTYTTQKDESATENGYLYLVRD